jgi:hypothetical protein
VIHRCSYKIPECGSDCDRRLGGDNHDIFPVGIERSIRGDAWGREKPQQFIRYGRRSVFS